MFGGTVQTIEACLEYFMLEGVFNRTVTRLVLYYIVAHICADLIIELFKWSIVTITKALSLLAPQTLSIGEYALRYIATNRSLTVAFLFALGFTVTLVLYALVQNREYQARIRECTFDSC